MNKQNQKTAVNDVPISVVIPTLNEENYIEPLLGSLRPQLKRGDETIIVDSYSSDGTVKIARKYTGKIFFMLGLSIGPAKNFGARHAKNKIVASLDADTLVLMYWLARVELGFFGGADVFYGYVFFSSNSALRQIP